MAEKKTDTGNDMITIRLPRERPDQENMIVWVNNERFEIRRGIPVEVPRRVAKVIEMHDDAVEVMFNRQVAAQKKV